jgi:hypothetical protein
MVKISCEETLFPIKPAGYYSLAGKACPVEAAEDALQPIRFALFYLL